MTPNRKSTHDSRQALQQLVAQNPAAARVKLRAIPLSTMTTLGHNTRGWEIGI